MFEDCLKMSTFHMSHVAYCKWSQGRNTFPDGNGQTSDTGSQCDFIHFNRFPEDATCLMPLQIMFCNAVVKANAQSVILFEPCLFCFCLFC